MVDSARSGALPAHIRSSVNCLPFKTFRFVRVLRCDQSHFALVRQIERQCPAVFGISSWKARTSINEQPNTSGTSISQNSASRIARAEIGPCSLVDDDDATVRESLGGTTNITGHNRN